MKIEGGKAMRKASITEMRFTKAVASQKVLTAEELKVWSDKVNKTTIKKIWADRNSIYYGHKANKHKDLGSRKNWRLKHPLTA